MSSSETLPVANPNVRFRVGTLQYTKMGLVWVFLMLLWGDLTLTLMEAVAPSIVPLRLKDLGTSDALLMIITQTIPLIIGTFTNPVISTASDRHRGPMGRRIPFMLFSTPFICGSLVLMAYSTEFGMWLHTHIGAHHGWSQNAMLILGMAILWVLFQILNMFAGTVYFYTFNDVVPPLFLSRFFALFRLVGFLGSSIWNWYIYGQALQHMKLVFLCAAGVYFVGFMIMSLGIKEGKYPPAEPMGPGLIAKIRTYAKECLCHRFYIYMFGLHIFWRLSWACQAYVVFLQRDALGLTVDQIGKINAVVNAVSMVLSYPAGMLSDRIHPMRVMLWIQWGLVMIVPLDFIWVYWNHLQVSTNFHILIVLSAVQLPLGVIFNVAGGPCAMRILPKSRYGQFGSFDAIVMAICSIGGTLLGAAFMTGMRHFYPDAVYGPNFCYRMMPMWRLPFLCVALMFLTMMYREWKNLGGATSYKVPGFTEEGYTAPSSAKPEAAPPAPAE